MLLPPRIVDGLSGGQHHDRPRYIADITTEENARRPSACSARHLGSLHRGPSGRRAFASQLHGAHLGGRGVTVVATAVAFSGCRKRCIARSGGPVAVARLAGLWQRAHLRVLFTIDFAYWRPLRSTSDVRAVWRAPVRFDAAHTGYC